jgi:hypothetical protein
MAKPINPFRAHIVEFGNGKFAVRKFSFPYWKYYDNQKASKEDYWWNGFTETSRKFFEVDTLEIAQTLLEMLELRKQVTSGKVVKVYQ